MKKVAILAVILVVILAGLAVGAYKLGWLGKVAPSLAPTAQPATGGQAIPSPIATAQPGAPEGGVQPAPGAPVQGVPPFDGNLASLEWGGNVEWASGVDPGNDALLYLIDGDKDTGWNTSSETPVPKEAVFSFFNREPALVEAVVIQTDDPRRAPRDVEVWTSMSSPTEGFTRVAATTLPESEDVTVRFPPVEARFVKVRLLRNKAGEAEFAPDEIRVIEAQRPGYTSLIARHPNMMRPPAAAPTPGEVQSGGAPAAAAASMPVCAPRAEEPLPSGHGESRRVLALTEGSANAREWYPISKMHDQGKSEPRTGPRAEDLSIVDRVDITVLRVDHGRPWMLGGDSSYDTVVLEQVCGTDAPMTPAFKQALIQWVAAGRKLIIHDSDKCVSADLSFLPFRLKTNNPGAQGAEGSALQFIEDNWMAHGRPGKPGYIDVSAWLNSTDDYRNELGDSNTVTEWDPHWCGHIAVRNVNNVFGFVETYAHYGRGLIIYGGVDIDQRGSTGYDVLVARELAQGFDPDNLPCAARLGEFVVTTDARLMDRAGVPGRRYVYPLTLLSNQAYKGTVNLSLGSTPGLEGLQYRFEPSSVNLTSVAESNLTVTLPAGAKVAPVALAVKGTDTAGKTNTLCLQLSEPRTGELSVISDLRPNRVAKNLEIVLDVSGSMKTPLGKKTRWTTALDVLQTLLAKLPDDFNVGLRLYGHREGSRSPKTCTDSELAVPINKLDREAVLNAAKAVKPKGETPLVYSVLQAPDDLKAVGGGTVIVITDGEESCGGDVGKAAAELKASGQNITLNIVGFTLTGQKAQAQLSSFAESTGGRFYAAATGEALGQALMIAAIDKFPYTVLDASGKVIAGGEAGAGAEELPPGTYTVVVEAGTEKLTADRVQVAVAGQTTLRIAVKNGRLVLEQ